MTVRLNKLLAQRGIGARRKCDTLIQEGAVRVNGRVVREPGTQVEPDRDRIQVSGHPLPRQAALRYIALNKPVGVITTLDDPEGRRSIRDFMPPGPRLFPVGRLDADTSGLLLLTNDGELAHHLMHPRYGVVKSYRVTLDQAPTADQLRRFRNGIEIEPGVVTAPAEARVLDPAVGRAVLGLRIHEGRYRQVRRMCEALGLRVLSLHRAAYGPLKLGMLARGMWRELSAEEIETLRASAARPLERGMHGFQSPRAGRRAMKRLAAEQRAARFGGSGSGVRAAEAGASERPAPAPAPRAAARVKHEPAAREPFVRARREPVVREAFARPGGRRILRGPPVRDARGRFETRAGGPPRAGARSPRGPIEQGRRERLPRSSRERIAPPEPRRLSSRNGAAHERPGARIERPSDVRDNVRKKGARGPRPAGTGTVRRPPPRGSRGPLDWNRPGPTDRGLRGSSSRGEGVRTGRPRAASRGPGTRRPREGAGAPARGPRPSPVSRGPGSRPGTAGTFRPEAPRRAAGPRDLRATRSGPPARPRPGTSGPPRGPRPGTARPSRGPRPGSQGTPRAARPGAAGAPRGSRFGTPARAPRFQGSGAPRPTGPRPPQFGAARGAGSGPGGGPAARGPRVSRTGQFSRPAGRPGASPGRPRAGRAFPNRRGG